MDMMNKIKFILAMFIVGCCVLLTVLNWGTQLGTPYLLATIGWLVVLMERTGMKPNDNSKTDN
jgi:thiol:disulfide interchange protein